MNNDTPETDRFFGEGAGNSVADFARRLERERNEADAYILSLWRNNMLPRPMPETLRDRLATRAHSEPWPQT